MVRYPFFKTIVLILSKTKMKLIILKETKDHNDFFENYIFVLTFQRTSSDFLLFKLQVKMLKIDSKTLL